MLIPESSLPSQEAQDDAPSTEPLEIGTAVLLHNTPFSLAQASSWAFLWPEKCADIAGALEAEDSDEEEEDEEEAPDRERAAGALLTDFGLEDTAPWAS